MNPDLAANPRLSQWIGFAADGRIEIRAGKVELGQGMATTLLQVAADELDVAPETIRLCLGATDAGPDQGITSGSNSTQVGAMALRQVCAEVRQLFVVAAARRLSVDPAQVRVGAGRFGIDERGSSFDYHELADQVDLDRPARGDAVPKTAAARRFAATGIARPDLRRKLFGAGFIHDLVWPGMLHARVVRPPSHSARLDAFDAAAVRALPGRVHLIVDGRFIAVAAGREEQAVAAAAAARKATRWSESTDLVEAREDQAWLRELPHESSVIDASGPEVDPAAPSTRVQADYSKPFLAHASIGPACALAAWDRDDDGRERLRVATHSQGSFTLRIELARFFGLEPARVVVRHADGAGCYGHNGADDAALDAAIVARATGTPVRLQWSREDEFAWAPFGSAMSVRIDAGLDAQGRIAHWNQQTWSHGHGQRPGTHAGISGIAATLVQAAHPAPVSRDVPRAAGFGGQRNAVPGYAMASRRIDYHRVDAPTLRSSSLRALGAYANVFAIESCMDELARMAGVDPLSFRLAHIDDPRASAVLMEAARVSRWRDPKAAPRRDGALRGRGLGFARYKGSAAWCAVVVEIEVTDRIVLDRIWAVVDAGEVVHRDGLVNQVEGGVLQAASWTLKEAVHWDRTRITTRCWDGYPILGFDELPRALSVHLIEASDLPPLGAGECAAGPTAGAIANALHDAIGIRLRDLPLTPDRLRRAVEAG
ncbi:MAG: molybdopterin cofactor-binding domain-containing protein [Burkholderiaceae bacterium]